MIENWLCGGLRKLTRPMRADKQVWYTGENFFGFGAGVDPIPYGKTKDGKRNSNDPGKYRNFP